MRTLFKISFLLLFVANFIACSNAPEGQKVESGDAVETTTNTTDATTYTVNTTSSLINWVGTKAIGDQHTGNLKLSKGELKVKDGKLVSGTIELDMQSINVTDLEGEYKGKLESHLKTGDFFEVETYPTGKFEIASVSPVSDNPDVTHNLTGNLELKGISKSVTIPANIAIAENEISAVTPNFTINRTDWGIQYNSGLLGTAKDKIINDEVGLQIQLSAAPQQAAN